MARFTANFLSRAFKRSVNIDLVVPTPVYPTLLSSSNRHPAFYPIVYLMPGDRYLGNAWFRYTSLERIAEAHNIAVVAFSTEGAGGLDETVCIPMGKTEWDQTEPSNFEEIRTYRFSDFLVYELPEFLECNFPISRQASDRYVAGHLESAYSAVLHAAIHPERYAAAGAFSYFQNNPACRLYHAAVAPDIKMPPVFIAQSDADEAASSSLVPALTRLNMAAAVWDISAPSTNQWDFWERAFTAFLEWLPRTDYYAENGLSHRKV